MRTFLQGFPQRHAAAPAGLPLTPEPLSDGWGVGYEATDERGPADCWPAALRLSWSSRGVPGDAGSG